MRYWPVIALIFAVLLAFQNCSVPTSSTYSSTSASQSLPSPSPLPGPNPGPGTNPLPAPMPAPYVLKDQWVPTMDVGAPAGRRSNDGEYAVWTGTKLVVFGGLNPTGNFLNSGGIYNPATESWASLGDISSAGVGLRLNPVLLAAGEKIICWGGNAGANAAATNRGAIYDLANGAKTEMNVLGAPSARSFAMAAWTGQEVVIFGGVSDAGQVGVGGRFNPATNTWRGMSAVNAPSARYCRAGKNCGHWTGSKVIFWGGGPASFNDGGLYDPVADTWTKMSTVGAPSARFNHVEVWTGKKLIVFGGQRYNLRADGTILNSVPFNDGAMFDPATNTWTAISQAGAPSPRTSASAVWTGTEMVVFGGQAGAGGSVFGDGAIFNPETNSWRPLVLTNAPTARWDARAFLLGNRLWLWGGISSASTPITVLANGKYYQ